jgi:hypothetical protein
MPSVKGGGNLLALYTINTTHTTIGAAPVIELSQTVSSTITRGDDGAYTVELDQITDSEALSTFLKTYVPPPEGVAAEEITFENGDKYGGATANSPDLLAILYGGVSDTDNKRKVLCAIVKGANTSGTYTQTSGAYNRPSLSFVSQRVLSTALSVGSGLFKNTLVTGANTALPLNSRGEVVWLTKA